MILRIKYVFLVILLYFPSQFILPQSPKPILDDQKLLDIIEEGLNHIYNIEIEDAYKIYEILKKERPNHPVTPLYKGLCIYWQHYPIVAGDDEVEEFLSTMHEVIDKAAPILKKDPNDLEGVFFDLTARALLMLYYADNGLSGKVLKIAPTTYKHVLLSFDLKDQFDEYYFITGLYNYYIVAYPEKHPVYKPISLLFKSGNITEGLEQLHYAFDHAIYLKTEAALFLAIIYFDYEKRTDLSIEIMKKLHSIYPENPLYYSQYVEYLLQDRQYELALEHNQQMVQMHRDNSYMVMKGIVFKGIIEEKYQNNDTNAKKDYELGLTISKIYGDLADDYVSYAYYGLSRIEKRKGNEKLSREYYKKASALSTYEHFAE